MPRKKNQAFGLGKALIKDRFGKKSVQYKHTSEIDQENIEGLNDNLKSVVELDSLDDFLKTAKLAGTEFTAERLNIKYVDESRSGLISDDHVVHISDLQSNIDSMLSVPRRPKWDITTSKDELESAEKESFLVWRRHLAKIRDDNKVELTPYEKNLDFWRQLWRVVERSDVVVQIVDARDPLLYRCPDLENYVKEVNPSKLNLILVNKADFLSVDQRKIWSKYWKDHGVKALFWSALLENEKLEQEEAEKKNKSLEKEEDTDLDPEDADIDPEDADPGPEDADLNSEDADSGPEDADPVPEDADLNSEDADLSSYETKPLTEEEDDEDSRCLTRDQLIEVFKSFTPANQSRVVVGMVGYPNVGKSSTVNTLMGTKRVAVSATPGRTKHFQTLNVDSQLCLCDCPGLVFPSYVANKAEMVLCGILPIDQMKDHVAPVNLLASRISRDLLNAFYGLRIALPREHEDPNRCPTSAEVLNAHALSRGFMTSHGQPDNSRSSRIVLKDYVNGKIVYSKPPPGHDIKDYQLTTPTISCIKSIVGEKKFRSTQQMLIDNAKNAAFDQHIIDECPVATFVVGSRDAKLQGGKGSKKRHFKKKEKIRRIRSVQY